MRLCKSSFWANGPHGIETVGRELDEFKKARCMYMNFLVMNINGSKVY